MRLTVWRGIAGAVRTTVSTFTLVSAMGVAVWAQDLRLVGAVERQDREAVVGLLAQRAEVNAAQADGATALHWAVHWNNFETATLLVDAGADPNALNELGVAPLALASLNASPEMVAALLRAGADPNVARPSGETALMTGARTGSAELVRMLLAGGAEINANVHFRGQTALMWAAAEGHTDVVRVLLEQGASVHARSQFGITALLLAARKGDIETARMLLESGADVNAAEPVLAFHARVDQEESQTSGRSPLLVAAASVVATSGREYHLEVKPSEHEDLAIFLLEQGADPNRPDSIGRTPLHAAVETGKVRLVQALLARGADADARLVEAPYPFLGDFVSYGRFVGATPLWLAAAARVPHIDILRHLVAAGADSNLPADDGTTPLMTAVGMVRNEARLSSESEALGIVRFLVERDIDVNAVDRRGRSAMHGAARLARNTLIPVLVEHGADVSIADANGLTPLDVGTVARPIEPDTAGLLRSFGGRSSSDAAGRR